jgi:chromate transporter
VLLWDSVAAQVVVIAAGALIGWRFLDRTVDPDDGTRLHAGTRRVGIACLVAFAVLLAGLPLVARATGSHGIDLFDSFYRAGALVFGGGHVVLPLLQTEVVAPGWASDQQFVAGYGAAQALPGPLFTFAGYLGYVMGPEPNGLPGAVLALAAIFLPGILLVVGALPFWDALRMRPAPRAALRGVNAAVVGLLAAALYDPVWVSAIDGPRDVALALAALALLTLLAFPPWAVVVLTGLAGAALVAWG